MDLGAILGTPGALTSGRSYHAVLVDTYVLLSDSSKWTQHAHARGAGGEAVKPTSPDATCWCVLGALARISNCHGIIDPQLIRYLDAFVEWKYPGAFSNFGDFNDYYTHPVVMGLLKEAIDNMDTK